MKSIRLKNYRCFEDTGEINFKPINILIGKNSSGKSSFLKFFPLLKQSRLRHSTGPFLWYADDVDFRDFKNTVRNGEGEITIEMNLSLRDNISLRDIRMSNINGRFHDITVKLRISGLNEHNQTDYLSSVNIEFNDTVIELNYDSKRLISVNLNGYIENFETETFSFDDFIPVSLFKCNSKDGLVYSSRYEQKFDLLKNALKGSSHRFMEASEKLLFRFDYLSEKEIIDILESDPEMKSQITENEIKQIILYYYLAHINDIIRDINAIIDSLASNVHYIQPLRAYAKRYSRFQNIAVEEIDSHGDNLPMYLYSLQGNKLNQLNNWINENFGFTIYVKPSEGHIEIGIKDGTRNAGRNLVDTGFGYSQLLPIIVKIWAASNANNPLRRINNRRMKTPIYIVIEQPELHLHPNLMRKFARMLNAIILNASRQNRQIVFIIETHSVALIEEIGVMLAQKEDDDIEIKPDNYQILLFNSNDCGDTTIDVAEYDENGIIQKWPYGFLS